MGFNRRKMEDQRRNAAEKEAAARRATDAQVLEDAERLIAAWNEREALRARRERPSGCGSSDKRDEVPSPHGSPPSRDYILALPSTD